MEPEHKRAPRSQEDAVWKRLFQRQSPAVARGMCTEFRQGFATIRLDAERMPRHGALSRRLHDVSGWRIETVPGLIPVTDFFAFLRERRFPATAWIRHPDDLEYTPEPDIFHDVFGHLPQLVSPAISAAIESLAERARGATADEIVELERVYWFTIEFGLVGDAGQRRALGAGLASSIAELERALEDPAVQRQPFGLDRARQTDFDPTQPQPVYMFVRSMEELATELCARKARRRPA